MKTTLLGTGAAGGIPLYGCDCPACMRARLNPVLTRKPSSAMWEEDGYRLQIDAGLWDGDGITANVMSPHSLLLTHFHMDHVQGLFPIRWGRGKPLTVYAPQDELGCADLYSHPGILQFVTLRPFVPLYLGPWCITPIPLLHSKPSLGYVCENAETCHAYLCDTGPLPASSLQWLRNRRPDLVVLDCTWGPGVAPQNHHNLDTALEDIQAMGNPTTVLTHIGHDLHVLWEQGIVLPSHVQIAVDGWSSCGLD